jgi:hypothetical protein
MPELKTGRARHSPWDAKRLSILDALPGKLPSPPARTTRSVRLPAAKIDILGNDDYGDCTVAAAAHTAQHLTYYETDQPNLDPKTNDVVSTYFDLTGGSDTGLDLLTVLNRWHKKGICGHTIAAYGEVPWADAGLSAAATRTLLKTSVWLSGSAYIAVWLPAAQQQNPFDWRTVGTGPAWRPGGWGGHCIDVVDYAPYRDLPGWTSRDGAAFQLETWGRRVWASEQYLRAYCDEAWLPVSKDFTNRKGSNPQGRTLAKLVELAATIARISSGGQPT